MFFHLYIVALEWMFVLVYYIYIIFWNKWMPQEWIFFPLDSETCYPTRGSPPFFASRCWGRGKTSLELEGKRCGHWPGLPTSKYVTLFCFTVGLFSLFCWKRWTSGAVWPLAIYTEWLDLLLSFVTMRVFLSFFVSLFTFCVRCLVFPRCWLRRAFCLSASHWLVQVMGCIYWMFWLCVNCAHGRLACFDESFDFHCVLEPVSPPVAGSLLSVSLLLSLDIDAPLAMQYHSWNVCTSAAQSIDFCVQYQRLCWPLCYHKTVG